MRRFDVVVIGSGPGGEKAAIQAAKLGKSVAVIEKSPYIGGAGLHTGTLPSKTLREAALYIAGFRERSIFGFQLVVKRDMALSELMHRKTEVIRRQMEVILGRLSRNNIELIYGEASFTDPNRIAVKGHAADEEISFDVAIIATGSSPARPADVPFDKDHIYDSDSILLLDRIPQAMTIIGAGVIGCEYACIFASLGVKVTLVEKKTRLLPFADEEIVTSLMYWMRHSGIIIRLGEEVVSMEVESPGRVKTVFKSGKVIYTEKLLYTMGRVGNTGGLSLDRLGIEQGERGIIKVNESYQTSVPNIYAVGDVVGFPSLASSSMEQGRRAVCHALSKDAMTCEANLHMPFGIYTIPEISMVGETEESLTKKGVTYETGCAFFHEVERGQIIGDLHGMLKLIFERDTKRLLGVHIFGERASEIIHIGQAVMNFGGTVDYFKDVVFNYPTLSDAYKQAALNGLNKL